VTEVVEDYSSPLLTEVGVDITEARERARVDFNFFASLAIPDTYIFEFPPFYIYLYQILTAQENFDTASLIRFALGLPRGHAKTTFIKVLIAWLVCFDKVKFVLVACANETLAQNLLADIHDILSSPNIETIFGSWAANVSTDRVNLKKAMYHGRPVILAAVGVGSSVRGIVLKNQRPDFILCDDAQTRENDESETERNSLMRWLVATLFRTLSPLGARTIVYIGNMYSDKCILNQFKNNSHWISLVTGAILADGTTLWPQLHSLESLMESYYHDEELGLGSLWFAEVMNDPVNPATALLSGPLPHFEWDPEKTVWDAAFITVDPAGFRKHSDFNVVAGHIVQDGECRTVEIAFGVVDPEELIIETLKMAIMLGASLIAVEDVAYQQTLQFWMQKYLKMWEMSDIVVVGVNPHGRTKESRIKNHVQELYAGNWYLADGNVRSTYVWQATRYRLGEKDNKDDILDAVAYGTDVRNDPQLWQFVTRLDHLRKANRPARVIANNTPF
jgi:hypothetical protein